jgi:hypothetical protein
MTRYAYNRQITPPAPFVHVSLRCLETGKTIDDLPAQLDTAADRTVVPGPLIEQLGLVPLDELPVTTFGGQRLLVTTYLVELTIRNQFPQSVEVLAHPEEPFLLLGRDVLNQHRLLLDGPSQVLEIG